MQKRRYTDEERALALTILDDNGGNLARTAKETGIPRTTIKRWVDGAVNGAVVQMRDEKKLELADLYEGIQRKILPVAEEKIKETGFKDLLTGAGIAADKMTMLRGDQPAGPGRVNIFVQMNQGVKG